ncbi:MAG: F0F1 ATP synthase subunit delta [Alphaproteobacteria bacterium]|nr:F0F1 ATP synthase subunit delta [Alphaproteobacteria bacterium]NCQ89067.1 F0F1 ATP synthase subunit delta [Alphaproteobacteria bacterium]NCT07967.1 F0F1 ATP synthase subunit delta [Alphaproteobacteria bacterium]
MRYASAFVDSAIESQKSDAIEKDLQEFAMMIAGSEDLKTFIKSPLISRLDQQEAITALSKKAKFQDITANFLALLAQNRRLSMIDSIIAAVTKDLAARRGEVAARVQTAFKLSPDQEKALQDALTKAVGKTVSVHLDVDESLIGGMVVTVGSQMIDDSIKRKLERLKIAMTSNANNNAPAKNVANEN